MRLAQTIKSASFKLALAYVLLFAASFGVLAVITYFSVTSELSRQFHRRIVTETHSLETDFRLGGVAQLLRTISERQRGHLVGGLDYSLIDRQGTHLFGTMPIVPCKPGWTTIFGPPDGDEAPGEMEQLGVYVTPLPNGMCLFVGNDWGEVQNYGRLVLQTFAWVFLLSLTLAAAGGLFLSSAFLRRIETIRQTADAIIRGDIRRRIPRRKAPDELDKLAATLNLMLDRMTGLMDSLRHLSNNIAHDLRTPLGRMQRLLETARNEKMTVTEYQAAIETCAQELDGVLEMFSAILRISQIESGNRRNGFRKFDFSNLVLETCETFSPAFEEDGKTLNHDVEPGLSIYGDPELLTLSLSNLLENANLHTPTPATVSVSLRHVGGLVELAVSDNGKGVPEPMREKIFERFFRVDSSRATAGNGLGLSIVAAVTELHAGRVFAEDNNPGLRIGMGLNLA
ncbi:MAG TPA: HAMP domain-containing sensor histidine kinase [Rhizomicrobium sp.]